MLLGEQAAIGGILTSSKLLAFLRQPRLRFLRRLAGRALSLCPYPVPVHFESGRTIYVDLRSSIGRGILATGSFDPAVFAPIQTALAPGDVFVDVGANVGYYSLLALDLVGSGGRVHAFEVDPRPLACLQRTVSRNRAESQLHVHELAVGDRDGVAVLVPKRESGHSEVSSVGRGRPVQIARLDTVAKQQNWARVKGLKIDVEGGEMGVLLGAQELLRHQRPVVVCEVVSSRGQDPQEFKQFFSSVGYSTSWIKGAHTPCLLASPISPEISAPGARCKP